MDKKPTLFNDALITFLLTVISVSFLLVKKNNSCIASVGHLPHCAILKKLNREDSAVMKCKWETKTMKTRQRISYKNVLKAKLSTAL